MNLGLLLSTAISVVPLDGIDRKEISVDPEDKSLMTEQESKNLKTCTQNLVAIGKALQIYDRTYASLIFIIGDLSC